MVKKGTYCPQLWKGAFIDQRGDVYACCHFKPGVLGNIAKEKLRILFNNKIIRYWRKKSLDGQLACFRTCTLLDKDKIEETSDKIVSHYDCLTRLKIIFSESCNIKCIMCWQQNRQKERIEYDGLIKNVDLAPFKSIELQGGEPLFDESARRFFDYAVSRGKKVSFLTNGLLIDDEWAEKIARHSSFISFSLNAATKKTHEFVNRGSRWERVIRNVERVREARKKYGTGVLIWGHMTLVVYNLKEICLFMKKFQKLGFDMIDFSFDSKVPAYLNAFPLMKMKYRKDIQNTIKLSKVRSKINTRHLRMLGLF